MAAERLTKARLAQILSMLVLLTIAFTWRTFNHNVVPEVVCQVNQQCIITLAEQKVDVRAKLVGNALDILKKKAISLQVLSANDVLTENDRTWTIHFDTLPTTIMFTSAHDNTQALVKYTR